MKLSDNLKTVTEERVKLEKTLQETCNLQEETVRNLRQDNVNMEKKYNEDKD